MAPSFQLGRDGSAVFAQATILTQLPQLQLIYDTAPIGLAFLTPDYRYAQINQRLTEICGISVEDHLGRTVRETVPAVAERVEEIVDMVIDTGAPVIGIEVHGQRGDKANADRVWRTNWHPLRDAAGRIVGVNVVAEDITERQRAEKALRELNETLELRVEAETRERLQIWNVSEDLLVITDLDGNYLSLNPAWSATLGWSDTDLLGKSWWRLVHPDDLERTRAETEQLTAGHKTSRFEHRFRHQDGSYRWLSWKAAPDRGRIYAMARDITELKDAEHQLQQARRELSQVARRTTLATMSAAIAHELRQPIGAVITNANAGVRWLGRSPPDLDEARDTFAQIAADGRRAAEVIQSVRAVFDTGVFVRTPLDANEIVRETVTLMRAEVEAAGAVVDLALADGLPAFSGHRGQLQQVLLNLVTNAIDAMRSVEGRARTLSVATGIQQDGGVAITVRDHGTGIRAADRERVFDTFFTTKPNGMGMGLAICRSIIESHGGRLSAEPAEPYGCEFRIALPRGD
jgi:PAS domain S-box-containing protein